MEAMKCLKHLGDKGPLCGSASEQAVMQMNTEKVPKPSDVDADPAQYLLRPGNTRTSAYRFYRARVL